ncbi:MAG: hypothetical protein Q4C85_02345 [Actinomyces sp.]|uniref:hypothetical protein n=1 Tax=Actinomyces sp. TaxID=29317 RepID=UPI0026DD716E|nr:hypothetical protein [Actinomyces sp.]MDO4242597.1 hypothetical protein [Actinomyces sp.]
MPLFSRRRPARLPAGLTAHLRPGAALLGAVPLAPDGRRWAAATARGLEVLGEDGSELSRPWHEVARGAWDAGALTFTITWIDAAPELLLRVTTVVEGGEVDVAPFARALRERVESALVHSASDTLPSGLRVTVSARRDEDGGLYTVCTPAPPDGLDEADRAALVVLERRVRDGVGLPTS